MSTHTHPAAAALDLPTGLLIGGEWTVGHGGMIEVADPATEEAIVEVADATPEDGIAALDAADAAQAGWAATAPRERGEILRRAFELMMERREDLGLLVTSEMGKPLAEALGEIDYAAEFFRWFSEEAVRIDGSYATAPNGKGRLLVMRQPVGPSILITPWNFPAAMATRKIGPAVAAGCTMVLKPAKLTPLTTLAIAAILQEAGLPEGVLNVVTTSRSGAVVGPLLVDSRARKLSFTGSTEVGRDLLTQAAQHVMRTSMELGGNAPFLVFEDADIEAAVEGAVIAKMRNIGEACTAANRFYVAEAVAEEFSERFARRLGAMKVGPGAEPGVEVGPLIESAAREKVHELVTDATGHGATALVGGRQGDGAGYFYEPTLLADVPSEARILKEEIFGPVAPVVTFDDEEQALELANSTEFGLVAYAFTRDVGRAMRIVEGLESGMVGLNQGLVSNPAAPFGGVKQSGLGREGGNEGILEFLETKYCAIAP